MTSTIVLDTCDSIGSTISHARLSAKVSITQWAACLMGTSAELIPGDSLTVEELMYGMMLPSGNDAA